MTPYEKKREWLDGLIDYKKYRKWLMEYAATVGFSSLPFEEQVEVAKNFACSVADIDSVLSFPEKVSSGGNFHANSQEARRARWRRVEVVLYNYLGTADKNTVINDISGEGLSLIENYKERGREGTESGDPTGVFDYLNATAGTVYETVGLRAKSITPNGLTVDALADLCLEILRGNI